MVTIPAEVLGPYKDHKRVLLIFAPSPVDETYLKQKRLLESAADGLHERDMVVLELSANKVAKELRDSFSVSDDAFTVILVGKDGSEKERFFEPVEPTQLFRIIDQMPMRQREMRKRD